MGRRTKKDLLLQERVVYNIIRFRIKKQRKINNRSIGISYRWISMVTGLTYKESRNTIQRLVTLKLITQFSILKGKRRACYYRLPVDNEYLSVDNSVDKKA